MRARAKHLNRPATISALAIRLAGKIAGAASSTSGPTGKILDTYSFDAGGMKVEIKVRKEDEFAPIYEVYTPVVEEGTKLYILKTLKGQLISQVKLDMNEIIDPKLAFTVRKKFEERANALLEQHFPALPEDKKRMLIAYLIQNTLGLGELEAPMGDEQLEEIVINSSNDPVWVYHKKHGWCRTNVRVRSEEMIYDYAAIIGRRVGKQINTLNPLMDAHLVTGDRVNATLFPISTFGNTITIRKFSKNPWTLPTLIESNCLSAQVASLLWLCIQNELSLLVSGGTGSGKTSFLNALTCMFPQNQRVISIEDTRELTLPSFLQWVPLSTREPNAEGKGEVSMLDLMVNSLRMRPDRIVVGEVRRQREAEIMFEAMHTGHAVYATIHADNAAETISRMTNPPINIPHAMLDVLSGIVVQFRHRRLGIRRTLEFAEVLKQGDINVLYRWDLRDDKIKEVNQMSALIETLSLYAGMNSKSIASDMEEKTKVLTWMTKHKYNQVDAVGRIVARYYSDPEFILSLAENDRPWQAMSAIGGEG
ncbi:putative KH and PIN-domain containing protein [uncultured archaeon]|nr:putative KH and PIN-domain containing protein [uncultured archaeon]